MILEDIRNIFEKLPRIRYGFTEIKYSELSNQYKSALVFAVPYKRKLSLETYDEEIFEQDICEAQEIVDDIMHELEIVFKENEITYYIPSVAQTDKIALLAPFSFKFAAVNAGIGWIGKNDVVITKEYGPRLRLSAVLIDYDLPCAIPIKQSMCPDNCTKCVDACPYNALTGQTWNIEVKRNEIVDYDLCNQKRSTFIKKLGRKNACGLCMVACPYGL